MDEQMKRGGLHNDISIPLYGMDAGGKRKVDEENSLKFL
jgi:hypothetical protein